KEWILWNLTSLWKTDISSLRGMVHQTNGAAAQALFAWAGVEAKLLPPIGDPFEVVGSLQPEVAKRLSLPNGIPVFLGWNDMNAAVLGAVGVTDEVCGFNMTGTSEHIGVIRPLLPIAGQASDKGIN